MEMCGTGTVIWIEWIYSFNKLKRGNELVVVEENAKSTSLVVAVVDHSRIHADCWCPPWSSMVQLRSGPSLSSFALELQVPAWWWIVASRALPALLWKLYSNWRYLTSRYGLRQSAKSRLAQASCPVNSRDPRPDRLPQCAGKLDCRNGWPRKVVAVFVGKSRSVKGKCVAPNLL